MKNLVMFGDSLTYGYGVYKKDSVAALLQNSFADFNIINSGANGDTTREALVRLKKDVLDYNPHIITILFGSNDCAPSEYSYVTVFEFEKNLDTIIKSIYSQNSKAEIILITPPPVDETVFMPWTTNKRLLPYCEAIRKKSDEYGCHLCDFNVYLTQKSNGELESFLQEDGCHLSEKGYICFFDCLSDILKKI